MYCVGFLLIVLALEVEFSCLDLLRFSSDETRTFYIFTIISSIYRYVLMEVPHTRESLFTHTAVNSTSNRPSSEAVLTSPVVTLLLHTSSYTITTSKTKQYSYPIQSIRCLDSSLQQSAESRGASVQHLHLSVHHGVGTTSHQQYLQVQHLAGSEASFS